MPTQTSDQTKEYAYLVRELIANLKIVKPQGDQFKFRVALAKKIFTELDKLTHSHLLRAYEALADVDFPEPEVVALRDLITRKLARLHNLKTMREVVIPGTPPPVTKPAVRPPR